PNTLYEMQDFPESKLRLFSWFVKRTKLFVVSNGWKAKRMKDVFGAGEEKVFLEYNAVDISKFDIVTEKNDARKKLGLPIDKKLVVYTGHLYKWKGVDTLASAASLLPLDYLVVFVGGTNEDVDRFKNLYASDNRINIVGLKPYIEIPLWQKAADALVLPNTAREKISLYYTSPMKLFEYMTSDRPIVASNILSIVEILNDKNSFLVKPDDPEDLMRGIKAACENKDLARSRATYAHQSAKKHSWNRRAKRILRFAGLN
ncbi:MAG: glycosyltransferase family 4 protein, partial [Patescibacteria group bacterium]